MSDNIDCRTIASFRVDFDNFPPNDNDICFVFFTNDFFVKAQTPFYLCNVFRAISDMNLRSMREIEEKNVVSEPSVIFAVTVMILSWFSEKGLSKIGMRLRGKIIA